MILAGHLSRMKRGAFAVPVLLVAFLICFLYYQFMVNFIPRLWHQAHRPLVAGLTLVLFNACVLLMLVAYAQAILTDPGKVTLTQFDLDDVPYAPSSYNSLSRGPSYSHVPTTPHSHSATPTDCDGDSETVELGA